MPRANKYKAIVGLPLEDRIRKVKDDSHKVKKKSRNLSDDTNHKGTKSGTKESKVVDAAPKKKKRIHRGNRRSLVSKSEERIKKSPSNPIKNSSPKGKMKDSQGSEESALLDRIDSSNFRFLNEVLYTKKSSEAMETFASQPELFKAYHSGYEKQRKKWPINPLDIVNKWLKKKPANLVVADMGCGSAELSTLIRQKTLSLDFVALTPSVIVCDMKKTPLDSESVDVCVFCLSLMGKNLFDFFREAHRILKKKGIVLVVEILSRFLKLSKFADSINNMGFETIKIKKLDDYFVFFVFTKRKSKFQLKRPPPDLFLKPCLYKKR